MKFWKDAYCGESPLCDSFPSSYTIAEDKEAWVNEYWSNLREGEEWSSLFIKPFNDWEVEDAEGLMRWLGRCRVSTDQEDRMDWRLTNGGRFSVKSMYQALSSESTIQFHGLIVLRSWVQPKVSFFT